MACNDINFNFWVFNALFQPLLFNSSLHAFKLLFVLMLVFYHLSMSFTYILSKRNNTSIYTSFQLRIWNELATLFLVVIIFIIVLKNELDGLYGTIGFILFGIILFIAVRWYKKIRKSN